MIFALFSTLLTFNTFLNLLIVRIVISILCFTLNLTNTHSSSSSTSWGVPSLFHWTFFKYVMTALLISLLTIQLPRAYWDAVPAITLTLYKFAFSHSSIYCFLNTIYSTTLTYYILFKLYLYCGGGHYFFFKIDFNYEKDIFLQMRHEQGLARSVYFAMATSSS